MRFRSRLPRPTGVNGINTITTEPVSVRHPVPSLGAQRALTRGTLGRIVAYGVVSQIYDVYPVYCGITMRRNHFMSNVDGYDRTISNVFIAGNFLYAGKRSKILSELFARPIAGVYRCLNLHRGEKFVIRSLFDGLRLRISNEHC
jgi:hypothetical protein